MYAAVKGESEKKGLPILRQAVPLSFFVFKQRPPGTVTFRLYACSALLPDRASSIDSAAFLPAPIARITVAAPVTASPPA